VSSIVGHNRSYLVTHPVSQNTPAKRTHYRWVVCALLFFATTIVYVDRQVFGLLGPVLTEKFGWSEKDFSFIVSAFTLAYAIGYSLVGRIMDVIGERKGFLIVFGVWSVAEIGHALIGPLVSSGLPWLNAVFAGTVLGGLTPAVVSVAGFSVVRLCLGLVEGGHFPGAVKTVGQWHPKRERALATGIFNSGSNVGAIVAIAVVPVALRWGWASAFCFTGVLSLVWLVFWVFLYDRPERLSRVSTAELAYIRSDPSDPAAKIPWLSLLRYRQTWAYVLAMFITSPVWWFYINWTPKFLANNHGIDVAQMVAPLIAVFLMADVGSIGGGALSSWLIRRGATINAARKTAFLICACCAVPVMLVTRVHGLWPAVFLVGLAAAAHAGFSANLYTIVSDTVPRKAVSSVVGMGGTAAGIGMVGFSTLIGYVLDWTKAIYGEKDYLVPFLIAGSVYLVATALIHFLLPRLEPMKFDEGPQT
jgi:MFS transporter, ACS family, hexuronate transporter